MAMAVERHAEELERIRQVGDRATEAWERERVEMVRHAEQRLKDEIGRGGRESLVLQEAISIPRSNPDHILDRNPLTLTLSLF